MHSLKWLSVSERIKYYMLVHVYKCIDGTAPIYMQDSITMFSELHNYETRDNLMLQLPAAGTNYMKRSFKFQGPLSWNVLPVTIKNCNTLAKFKCDVKDSLLGQFVNH